MKLALNIWHKIIVSITWYQRQINRLLKSKWRPNGNFVKYDSFLQAGANCEKIINIESV